MPGAAVRRANPGDVETISRSLARAFEADPVMTWVFPGARLDKLERFFALVTQRHHLGHGEVWMSADGASAALWDPPGRWRMPAGVVLRMARMVGPRGALLLRGLLQVEARHPRWPHWYLAILGTDPPMQGHGLGAAVMEPVLRRCDEDGIGAYLESSKERNVPYYRRHGFEVVDEIDLPRGPRIWLMWREPARGSAS